MEESPPETPAFASRSACYLNIMSNENEPVRDRNFKAGLIGFTALAAWFALLWFMFGDVL